MIQGLITLTKRFFFGTPEEEVIKLNSYKETDYLRNELAKLKQENAKLRLTFEAYKRIGIIT